MKHIFIINPAAGKKDKKEGLAGVISDLAKQLGLEYRILITYCPHHAEALVKQMRNEYPCEHLRFYACGGDGTLNEVSCGVSTIDDAAVAHYPTGTGNDFIKSFDCTDDFFDLSKLCRGEEKPIDYIEFDDKVCVNVLSVGIDADVAAGMQKYKRLPLIKGQGSYVLSLVENMLKGIGASFKVNVDSQDYSGDYTLIFAGNGGHYGGGFSPVPDADVTDGELDILLVNKVNVLKAAKVVGTYKEGNYKQLGDIVKYMKAKQVCISDPAGRDLVINYDGEIIRKNEIFFKVSDKKLNFVIPAKK